MAEFETSVLKCSLILIFIIYSLKTKVFLYDLTLLVLMKQLLKTMIVLRK